MFHSAGCRVDGGPGVDDCRKCEAADPPGDVERLLEQISAHSKVRIW